MMNLPWPKVLGLALAGLAMIYGLLATVAQYRANERKSGWKPYDPE
jgi:hypothetical protein